MESAFRGYVRRLQDEGATILLSSHILSEAEALSDRISIIREGRIVESGALADLRHLARVALSAELDSDPAALLAAPGVHDVVIDGRRFSATVDPEHLGAVLAALAAAGVRSLESHPPTLEQLFLSHYGVSPDGPSQDRAAAGGAPTDHA
jgi:ABC-2 type transport system ATP-binding protein